MFIAYYTNNAYFARNLNSISALCVLNDQILDYGAGTTLVQCESDKDALARFNDILDAALADQKVYDTRNEVGYWKKAKPGPKPKAKAPASQEHEEPAPKK